MKRTLIAVATAAIMIPGAAGATDIYNGQAQPAQYQNPLFTGLGIGIHGGLHFDSIEVDKGKGTFDGLSADGITGGAGLEYLLGIGRLRYGIYGDVGVSNASFDINDVEVFQHDFDWGGGLVAGVMLYNTSMFYGKVGYKVGYGNVTTGGGDLDVDYGAWDFRLGVQSMVSSQVAVGVEGQYLQYDDVEVDGEATPEFDGSDGLKAMVRLTWWPQY